MIKIVDVKGLSNDAGEYRLLDKRQQKALVGEIHELLARNSVKAKVIIE